MKKFIYSVIGLATLLLAAGCQREVNGGRDGDLVDASFSVSLEGLQTKAYSDGKSATKLQVLVYNSKGYLENVSKLNETINISTTVNLKLVKGETYDIVFWAQDPTCTAYTIDKTNAKLTVTTTGDANDEKRDAFYNAITFGPVEGPINQTVELRRPFAQINVLDNIDDWNAAVDNSINFTGSSMKVKAPNALDLKSGEASGEEEYTFAVKTIDPDADSAYPILSKDGTQLYKYIAMNYILAGEKDLKDVNFGVYRDNETDALYSTDVPNVPYQRNFRTIIIGNIFAVDGVFNVIIVPEYETPDYNVMLDGDPQTITPSTTAPIASADGYSYDADTQTGTVSTVAGSSLNFAGAVTSNSPFDPEYYSSNPAVGTIDKTTGAFTAVSAGTTVVTIHYNAVQNGVEVKADPINLAAADIKFTVTVTAAEPTEAVAAPVFSVAAGEVEAGTKVAITTTTEGATIYYSLTDAAPATEYKDAIEITEAVTIKAYAKKEGMKDSDISTAEYTVKAVTPVSNHGKVASDPFTVAEARAYIDAMEDSSVASSEDIFVAGVISAIKYTFNSNFGTATFTMTADGAESEETFVAYGAYYKAHEQKWTDTDTQIAIADKVVVCGKVLKYSDGTYETSNKNGYVVSIERGPVAFGAAIDNTDEVAAGGGTKTITITGNVDWTVEGTTGLTFSATSGFGAATVKVTVPANTDTENGKDWTVNVKTTATGLTANAYPFNFTQAKYVEPTGDETVVSVDQDYLAANKDGVIGDISYTNSSDYGTTVVTELRIYKGKTLTFTVPAGKTLTKVVLTCTANGTAKQGPGCFGTGAPEGYTFEAEGPTGTWTGSATESLSFTATDNQVRITAIEVTYK